MCYYTTMALNENPALKALSAFRKTLSMRAARSAGWDPDAGRRRKDFMDEVMAETLSDPSTAERAWTILELIDKFETADGYLLKRGAKFVVIKLRNDEETTLLEISPTGELGKPSKRSTTLLSMEKIKAYRLKLEAICPDRMLTTQEQVEKVHSAAMSFEESVRRSHH